MSNSNLKSAKFFCENCGAEVPQNARVCRHCGRFFSSVRCPQCGTTGGPNKFTNGCPTCGYAFNSEKSKGSKQKKLANEKKASRKSRKDLRNAIDSRSRVLGFSRNYSDDSLPIWVYFITFLGVLFILFLIYKYIFG